ncbi:MAG: phosphoribosylglycinamide formyltransferase [Desulfuromonadales bacterium]|nr:phosphoribosylglycinamide formyltransferase [Desulfuromonadales bacterium]
MTKKINLGVLISGNGTNLQAIIDASEAGSLDAVVKCVISNKVSAFGLERARKHGIEAIHLDHKQFENREAYDAKVVEILKERNIDLVILAGFMRIVTPVLLEAFKNRVMNIHPALLPAFPGLDAQKQALEYGAKVAGCTIHFVDAGTDTGPIILQKTVPILENDTEETLSERIHKEEHKSYPEAIQLFAKGRLSVEGRRVRVLPEADK